MVVGRAVGTPRRDRSKQGKEKKIEGLVFRPSIWMRDRREKFKRESKKEKERGKETKV